ncbi:MAG: glycosyl hydrolase family 28-related protein, partial [Planctomycetota bacterium]
MLKFDSRCPIVVLLVFGSVTIAPPSACAEVADPEAVRVLDPDIAKPQREATAADRIGPDGWVYTDFSRAGVPGGIPDVPATVRAEDFGAVPGDDLDDAAAIQRAVDHVVERGQPGAVTLGEGEFVIDRTVDFRGDGIVIRGAGPEQTVLIARFAGQPLDKMGHRSEAPRKPVLSWSGVSQDEAGRRARSLVIEDAHRGDREVVVEDAKRFRVGDPVTIANRRPSREILDVINPQMRDKLRKAYQRSVDRGYFQAQGGEGFAIIAQISGNRLLLDRPLLHDLPLKQEPFVDNDSNYLRGGGAEGISIVQEDATKTQINGINLFRVIGVWVRDVKIGPIGSWPLEIEKAAHCEVRDSHFDDTFARGGGGVGYFGLSKSHYCLVDHVRVERLRHMSLQMSSSGNVVRRCTLRNADLQFHLHWPSDNLIEQCDIDAGWGSEESRGTYGVGVYSPSFFNEQHLPAGRFNAYYNNTIVSPYQ